MLKNTAKYIVAGVITALVFAVLVVPAHATYNLFPKTICHHTPGNNVTHTFQNWQSYSGHLGQSHSRSTYDTDGACPTASPTASPTATPTVTPTVTPSASPTSSPEASPSATPTESASPSATPTTSPDPTATPEVRTDLSDGRSDGQTGSLGCLKPSDNCNPAGIGGGQELPATGGSPDLWFLLVPVVLFIIGVWMVKGTVKDIQSLRKSESSSKNQTQ